jgi:hypothetical protein
LCQNVDIDGVVGEIDDDIGDGLGGGATDETDDGVGEETVNLN